MLDLAHLLRYELICALKQSYKSHLAIVTAVVQGQKASETVIITVIFKLNEEFCFEKSSVVTFAVRMVPKWPN